MKTNKPNLSTCVLSAVLLTASTAYLNAQTLFQSPIVPVVSGEGSTNQTNTGWTQPGGSGQQIFTSQGLSLSYDSASRLIIDNIDDFAGSSIPLNNYWSTTIGLGNFDALAGYTGDWEFTTMAFQYRFWVDAGESFEIRTSIDNFADTLLKWNDPTSEFATVTSPMFQTSTNTFNKLIDPIHFANINEPIEIRYYYWNEAIGGDGMPGNIGDSGTQNYTNTFLLTVPEPSSMILLGLSGTIALLRRRRA